MTALPSPPLLFTNIPQYFLAQKSTPRSLSLIFRVLATRIAQNCGSFIRHEKYRQRGLVLSPHTALFQAEATTSPPLLETTKSSSEENWVLQRKIQSLEAIYTMELREGSCFPRGLVGVNAGLSLIDGVIAFLAFAQLLRIHSRNSQLGWTRQKVFHLMIGSTNIGYCTYFLITLIAACEGWQCWSHSCGFIFMAFPNIMFIAAFLLLLSFWIDLCHQADDEDEEDDENNYQESLLVKTFSERNSMNTESPRRCFPFRLVHIRSRQRIVILVTLLVFAIMIACAVVIWIGMGINPIDSALVARVYVDMFAAATLLLAVVLACYGVFLCLKMNKVRTDRASSEVSKVAGLAVVCVTCFISRAFVALFTDIPMLYHWHDQRVNDVRTSLLLIVYYSIGSSVPSAFLLWVMREVPPLIPANLYEESATLTFVSDSSATIQNPPRWTTVASVSNQNSRASPI